MIPIRIKNATHRLKPPKDWTDTDGKCLDLTVRKNNDAIESAWEPTPAELELLNAGGSVILRVAGGGQPPVLLYVEPIAEPV